MDSNDEPIFFVVARNLHVSSDSESVTVSIAAHTVSYTRFSTSA